MSAYPNCTSCDRPMRPHGTKTADHPGTVGRASATTCAPCALKAKPVAASSPAPVDLDAPCVLVRTDLRPSTYRKIAGRVGAANIAEALSRIADLAVRDTEPQRRRYTRLDDAQRADVRHMIASGYPVADVASSFGVSVGTVNNIVKETQG